MAWKKIADKGDVPTGGGKAFKIDGKQIAIFNSHLPRFCCSTQHMHKTYSSSFLVGT